MLQTGSCLPKRKREVQKRTKTKRAFTILEVLIATAIAGVAIFALMEAFNRGYLGAGQVEDYTLAISLSQEQLEQLNDSAFGIISSAPRAPVAGFSDFEQETTVTSVHEDLKAVVVTTYWAVPNGENSVSLTTYVVNA